MADKTQWPKADHGFLVHAPLLKSVAGRHKTERHKGCSDKKGKKGNTNVLSVRTTVITGRTAGRVAKKILKQ